MAQVLAVAGFELEGQAYAKGTVITMSAANATWLKSRKLVEDDSTIVAAAISGGATQVTHVASFLQEESMTAVTDSVSGVGASVKAGGKAAKGAAAVAAALGKIGLHRLKKSPIYSQRHMGAMNTGYGAGTARTWSMLRDCGVQPTHARLEFEFQEASAVTINKASLAVWDGNTAYPGTTASWLSATFGGATSLTTAANSASNRVASPTLVQTDWIALPQWTPKASYGRWGVMGRAYFDGSTAYSYWTNNTTQFPLNSSVLRGRMLISSGQATDGVTTPANFTNGTPDYVGVIAGISFMTDQDAVTVMVCGDSVPSGLYTTGDVDSATYEAVMNIEASGYPISCMNAAYGGASPSVYQPRAKAFVSQYLPTIAVYYATSINNPINSQSVADSHYAYAMDFVRHCVANNVVPIITTGCTHNLGSVGADVYRQAFIARLKAAAATATTWMLCDTAGAVADPAAPYQMLAAYDAGVPSAQQHPNSLGQVAMSVSIEAAIRSVMP
jgi:hypothetical protein